MKIKKMFAGLLSVMVLSMATLTVFASPTEDLNLTNSATQIGETMLISEREDKVEKFAFGSFRGIVTEINDFTPIKGAKIISLEDKDKLPINMIVSKDTFVVNNAEIKVGSTVTGYYDANAPMIMIYPPQYNPEVVVVDNQNYQVKVDVFNGDLISSDNTLKLNISEDTKVMTQDGKEFKGELSNRKLVIIYDISTKSIPAQTTPLQVIVLPQEQIEEVEKPVGDVSKMPIMVKDKKLNTLPAYTNDHGVVMVPLRPIAEALELEVVWEGKSEMIKVGIGATLTIGKDNYTFAKMAPIKLGTAPELVKEATFVPLDFFTKVMQMDKAEIFENQIIIK